MENNENINNQVNESNNTQEKKQNNSKTIGIVLLIIGLLLLGVGGYKLFIEKGDRPNEKENSTPIPAVTPTPNNDQVTPTPGNTGTANYSDWTSYILSQSSLTAKAIRYDCGDESNNKTIELTINQLKDFFDKVKDNELIDYIMDGTGDSGCGDYLLLSYSVNGKMENLEIQENRLWSITDNKLYEVLDNSNIKKDYTECTVENKECYSGYYGFKNKISFVEYLK